jgi:hypothetical protein
MFDDLFTDFVLHAPLPLGADAAEAIQALPRQQLLLIAYAAVDLLGEGFGHALVEQGIARAQIPAPLTAAALEADAGVAAILRGERVVGQGDPDEALVRLLQRAMQAVSARVLGAPRELALPAWGADGDFGAQTARALAGLRAWRGLRAAGGLGAEDARALLALLARAEAPDLWATADAAAAAVTDAGAAQISAGAARVAAIARAICAADAAAPFEKRIDGRAWRYHAELFGTQAHAVGMLRGPGGIAYGLNPAREYWKCNIFGGVVLSLAELPVPTFFVGQHRHYPRAERFGLALARKAGWEMVTQLDHRDPDDPTVALRGPTQEAQIEALLRAARPGDLLFVDHPGEPGENGGHTRVCVEAASATDPDAAPLFAQARQDAARLERDGLAELGGGHEIQLWLLRYTG